MKITKTLFCLLTISALILSTFQIVLAMDLARVENRTDQAVAAFGVDGTGTIET